MGSNQDACVLCGHKVDGQSRSFEQRLVDDRDFCTFCWNDIMYSDYDSLVSYRSQGRVQVPWAS